MVLVACHVLLLGFVTAVELSWASGLQCWAPGLQCDSGTVLWPVVDPSQLLGCLLLVACRVAPGLHGYWWAQHKSRTATIYGHWGWGLNLENLSLVLILEASSFGH
ncbi:UNVERIFIED_CONTAM: hypothetical protein K2H54_054992 [Gekko kuhli]